MTPDPLSDDSNLTSLPDDEDLLARLDLAAHEALEGTEEGLHSSSGDEEGSMDVDAAPEPAAEMNRKLIERWHPDVATMWEDLEASPVIRGNLIDQPIDISRELKPFQLQGLSWMMQQEQSRWKGGLLGDEMGMGKTIQAVSLIMSDFPATLPTIVVMPPVAMLQWQKEIGDYTSNKLKVLVYHGLVSRKLTVKDLRNYHVIIVSYHTLAAAHSKQTNGRMVKDKRTGSAMLVKEPSLLHSVRYHRAILDEAHSIKGRTTLTALACFALDADYRWCLSGTPLQNRIGELLSLFRFLQVRPFGTYECKSCKCSDFAWNIDKDTRQCTLCPHGTFDHISLFNLDLLTPIVTYGNTGEGREAFAKLQLLLARMMLRRVKADYSSSMELPSKDVTIRNEFFSDVERDFAMSIMRNGERQFDTYVAQGVFLNNYANIFGLIMKMRQVADHPDLILRRFAERGQNVLVCSVCDDPAEDAIRSVCHHDFCRACAKAYLSTIPQDGAVARCPRCFISLSIDLEQEERTQEELAAKNSIINRIQMDKWTSSTKIEALVHDVLKLRRSNLGKTKIIIFSQFTSMLELMEWRLRRLGIDTVMLNGSMTPEQRQAAINHFMSNASVDAFLVSLRAGGVALNLTEASHVFIIDPWWNPAAEWQSADRCHRMGQGRACTVRRIVIEDSVESRIVLLQEKKSNMISGTVNADGVALDRITPLDMQFLFRGN
ncbi:MAG: DNA repair protein rad16 [Phylliscum demangeonii]|nr:MAG: DNA repair protein rad16 [Phylliscum demangeonii]